MKYILALMLSLTLSGCTGLGMVATQTKQFTTTQTLQLQSRPANFVDAVVEVGKSLNYDYTGGDEAQNIVRFSDNGKFGLGTFIGQGRQLYLEVKLLPNGKTVQFNMTAAANYSQASEEKTNQRLDQFKTALQNRLR